MNLGLITTTINVPLVLKLYAAIRPDAAIFVTGDRRTPHGEVRRLEKDIPSMVYLDVDQRQSVDYSCSGVMGWETVCHRNIAILEAMRAKCDVTITIDDDNRSIDATCFSEFERILSESFLGVAAAGRVF